MRTLFLTGATGLLGSHIARRYVDEGRSVVALKRSGSGYGLLADIADRVTWVEGDIMDIPSLEAAITPGIDVIHAAAIVSFHPRDRAEMERINVEGTANVVNVCLSAGVRKLGFVSSVAALGRPTKTQGTKPGQPVVIDEEQKWEESPNNSAYAKTKYRAELDVWRGVAEGLNAVIVNPSVILGVGDGQRSSAQLLKYVADEKRFYTDGLLNYVDVLDVADALYQLMESDISGERYVLNAGTVPYKDFLQQAAATFGKRPPTVRVPAGLAEVLWRVEAVRGWLTGSKPLITRETARSASSLYAYNGQRIMQRLGIQYRSLDATLRRVAGALNAA